MYTKVHPGVCFVRQPTTSGFYLQNSELIANNTKLLHECRNGCETLDYGNKAWVVDSMKDVNVLIDECQNGTVSQATYMDTTLETSDGMIQRPKFTTLSALFIILLLIEFLLG
ncbi:hypothetical protein WALSEDRAFT_61122 [Wallemia mellicola CBS 633.66]|uniref:Uncharacterized protein n=1 Tax=Wallemia mellicola (strain ATCC MYA-4683 / CBS 633.66) TaxID=671144 RepID=I4Y806_WALMC|nr:hypothetical protein WALSEDRAFT_61122 [Wallemia mellicola CBS 633.66]EIM20098.1 hypothetical protein WALSEDRAFT_61122 [Wallemia mellicola CBS 633.66]|eukprot:XP_006959819.1 hypothetical protein WALSEDRAFT_61122 [Wallemia mellicola CBS 633.66]